MPNEKKEAKEAEILTAEKTVYEQYEPLKDEEVNDCLDLTREIFLVFIKHRLYKTPYVEVNPSSITNYKAQILFPKDEALTKEVLEALLKIEFAGSKPLNYSIEYMLPNPNFCIMNWRTGAIDIKIWW